MNYSQFKKTVWKFYAEHGRGHLPWRKTRDPYKILVSEIMLQQTQVDRVIPKYKEFLKKFPTVKKLAEAENKEVLKVWQGLGYNRRALALKRAAEIVSTKYKGKFPDTLEQLLELPGIGPATAGDLLAFAFNKPAVVIETNIRTVFIHHFFPNKKLVSDKELTPIIEVVLPTLSLPRKGAGGEEYNVRNWYYALMDYGTYLKKELGNNIHRSSHYKKQSPFKGSNREIRSHILKLILNGSKTEEEILKLLNVARPASDTASIKKNLIALEKEGLIKHKKGRFSA